MAAGRPVLGRKNRAFTDEEVHIQREGLTWLVGAELGLEPQPSDTTSQLARGRARTQMLKIQHECALQWGDTQPQD